MLKVKNKGIIFLLAATVMAIIPISSIITTKAEFDSKVKESVSTRGMQPIFSEGFALSGIKDAYFIVNSADTYKVNKNELNRYELPKVDGDVYLVTKKDSKDVKAKIGTIKQYGDYWYLSPDSSDVKIVNDTITLGSGA